MLLRVLLLQHKFNHNNLIFVSYSAVTFVGNSYAGHPVVCITTMWYIRQSQLFIFNN
jgi:hypothetical protein